MVFSSALFLTAFLPTFLLLYCSTPTRFRNHVALAASYLFYAWGAPRFVFVLFASSAIDYWLGRLLERIPRHSAAPRRRVLGASLALNLGLLAYCKYADFFVDELNALIGELGGTEIYWTKIALPIGISFFTFQKISYIVDVYRGIVRPARSLVDYALYVAMFPQLIAGPLIRYHDIADQLRHRTYSSELFFSGVWRFCLGLGKKVLVANCLATVTDRISELAELDLGPLPTTLAWFGIFCYAFQIYFDFSGYSDMAIGLGRMMGFQFLENFNCPYISASFTEFWRRWHISLSNFMREYLYVPLGGNRVGPCRTIANLWIVFLLSGLWHGAGWNFLVWGAYHGLFLSMDKVGRAAGFRRAPKIVAVPLNFVLLAFGWVFFRADSMADACDYAAPLLGIAPSLRVQTEAHWHIVVSNRASVVFLIAAMFSFLPAWPAVDRWLTRMRSRQDTKRMLWLKFVTAMLLLALAVSSLANLHFSPFIYFRF